MYNFHYCFLIACAVFYILQNPAFAENLPTQNWRQRLPWSNSRNSPSESSITCELREWSNSPIIQTASPILVACADTSVEATSQSNSDSSLFRIPQLRNLNLPNLNDHISQVAPRDDPNRIGPFSSSRSP
jgi:hypothetical protein